MKKRFIAWATTIALILSCASISPTSVFAVDPGDIDPAMTVPSINANYPNGGHINATVTANQTTLNLTFANQIQSGTAWYYSLDGSDPDNTSTPLPANRVLQLPIAGAPITIKAVAYRSNGGKYSNQYTCTIDKFLLAVPTSATANVMPYRNRPTDFIVLTYTATGGSTLRYNITIDGTEPAEPTSRSALYTTNQQIPFPVSGTTRIKATVFPPDNVTEIQKSPTAEFTYKIDSTQRSLEELKTGTWSAAEKKALIEEIMSQLSTDEKVEMLGGNQGSTSTVYVKAPAGVAGGTYSSLRMRSIGIANMALSDGPAGVNFGSGATSQNKATAFPSPTSLASTWNKNIMYKVGKQTGKEAAYYGIDFMLGPAHDILRNPLSGRNFEYYSEDPTLSGWSAAAYIEGMQSEGVGATVKHFAGNEQESFGNGGSPTDLIGAGNTGGGNVIASERALREIYLKTFEIPVREAKPWSVMSSYNAINDFNATGNKWLLTDVLRNDWGWDGMVMSDWGAVYSGPLSLLAQMDLAESGLNAAEKNRIRQAIAANKTGTPDADYPELTEDILDRSIYNILNTMTKTNIFNDKYGEWGARYDGTTKHKEFFKSALMKEGNNVATEAASEAMVLLKNDGVLPLQSEEKIGFVSSPNLHYYASWGRTVTSTEDFVIRGAGSSGVYVGDANPTDSNYGNILSFKKVLTERGRLANVAPQDIYQAAGRTKTVTYAQNTDRTSGETMSYTTLPAVDVVDANLSGAALALAASDADHGVMIISRQTGEGYDNVPAQAVDAEVYRASNDAAGNEAMVSKGYYLSTVEEKALKTYADALHAKGKKFIVLLNVGSVIDTTVIDEYADAILVVWYPGQNGANVMADVLYGVVNPSGKTTQTFLKNFKDSPSVAAALELRDKGIDRKTLLGSNYYVKPGVAAGFDASNTDTNGGWGTNPVFYDEGVLVGYRWFDTKYASSAAYKEKVAYPFGFGLSYTSFEFRDLTLDKEYFDASNPDDTVTATVTVKNTGTVKGKEVVQFYLGMDDYASEGRPQKDLRGYEKVDLNPGESKQVSYTIKLSDLQYFDDGQPADKVLSGAYAAYQSQPGVDPGRSGDPSQRSNVKYDQGKGWTVNLGSVFNVIVGDTSENAVLAANGQTKAFTYETPATPAATYTVTYDANGGTGRVTDPAIYTSGASVTVKAATGLAKSGYEFTGWNTAANGSGTAYAPNATFAIKANTTLYAQWKSVTPAVTYTVIYDSNGGTGRVTDPAIYTSGASVTVKAATGLAKSGYEFTGWNTAANGSGTAYAVGATFAIKANTALYAQWKAVTPAVTYTVTYDANGGTGRVTNPAIYTSGASVTVKAATGLAKSGYEFTGWNTAANGSGTAYAPNATFAIKANTTLYAQWKAVGSGDSGSGSSGGPSSGNGTVPGGSSTGTSTNTPVNNQPGSQPSDSGQPAIGITPTPTKVADFSDASLVSSWATAYLDRLISSGIMNGYSDGTLAPKGNVTRAEFTKLIVSALKLTIASGGAKAFNDVNAGDWFKEFVDIASSLNLINGIGDGIFAPNAQISRQDLCAIAYRALQAGGKALPAEQGAAFTDDNQIADYAKEAVYALRQAGVISGRDTGAFDPKALATREETSKIIVGIMDYAAAN